MQDQINEVISKETEGEVPSWVEGPMNHIGDMCEAGTDKLSVIAYIDSLNLEKDKRDQLFAGAFTTIGRALAQQQGNPLVGLQDFLQKMQGMKNADGLNNEQSDEKDELGDEEQLEQAMRNEGDAG